MTTYETFDDAYIAELNEIYHHAEFFNEPRGFSSREKLGVNFKIENPVQRIVYSQTRKTNIIFNFAEALWYLTGNNSLSYISYYNKRMPDYSMDGQILTGTAYGKKLFHFGEQNLNQWQNVKQELLNDADSKRAVIQIFDAHELTINQNLDVSCTLGLQFLIRNNQLNMVAYMRANDAFRGIVSDIFSFTFIQEFMARELNLKVGKYYHSGGTMHIYEPDNQWVTHVLNESNDQTFISPKMPQGNNWAMVHELMNYEEKLRKKELTMNWVDIQQTELSSYWQQILALFSIYQMIYYHEEVDQVLFDHLLPVYQHLLLNRWPTKMSRGMVSNDRKFI